MIQHYFSRHNRQGPPAPIQSARDGLAFSRSILRLFYAVFSLEMLTSQMGPRPRCGSHRPSSPGNYLNQAHTNTDRPAKGFEDRHYTYSPNTHFKNSSLVSLHSPSPCLVTACICANTSRIHIRDSSDTSPPSFSVQNRGEDGCNGYLNITTLVIFPVIDHDAVSSGPRDISHVLSFHTSSPRVVIA